MNGENMFWRQLNDPRAKPFAVELDTPDSADMTAYMAGARQLLAAGEALAETVSLAVAHEIAPYIDGYYLMTPFGRTGLMARIMAGVRAGEGR